MDEELSAFVPAEELVCHLCGRPFGALSLFRHIPTCLSEQLDPLPLRETEEFLRLLSSPRPLSPRRRLAYNEAAIDVFLDFSVFECHGCRRHIVKSSADAHRATCTASLRRQLPFSPRPLIVSLPPPPRSAPLDSPSQNNKTQESVIKEIQRLKTNNLNLASPGTLWEDRRRRGRTTLTKSADLPEPAPLPTKQSARGNGVSSIPFKPVMGPPGSRGKLGGREGQNKIRASSREAVERVTAQVKAIVQTVEQRIRSISRETPTRKKAAEGQLIQTTQKNSLPFDDITMVVPREDDMQDQTLQELLLTLNSRTERPSQPSQISQHKPKFSPKSSAQPILRACPKCRVRVREETIHTHVAHCGREARGRLLAKRTL